VKKLALLATVLIACGGGDKKTPVAPKGGDDTSMKGDGGTDTAAPDKGAPASGKPLYERLGGQKAVQAVVDDFIGNLAADTRINLRFFNTDIPKLNKLLVEFVCMATGGPCKYTGQGMEESHAGMELVDEEFVALVEDLVKTLDKFKVPKAEKDQLLGALGPLQPQIVTKKERLKPAPEGALKTAAEVATKLSDKEAKVVMEAAILAAKRGQRNYADQLFSKVEILVGAKTVAAAVPAFRDGAPPRIDTPLKKAPKDAAPQPKLAGNSEDDEPNAKRPGALKGNITVDGKPLTGVGMVLLYPTGGGYPKRTPKVRTVEQRDKTFLPRLLAVPPGSTVAFPNYDGIYHNVFSLSSTKKFDVGLYKDGDSREIKFDKPGMVRLGCNIHAKMASFIFVVDAPAYVVVEPGKEFKFNKLAAGKYKVKAWSEFSTTPTESEITIKAGENTANFDVKGDAEKGPSEDKFGMTRSAK
jgi:hemoglobin